MKGFVLTLAVGLCQIIAGVSQAIPLSLERAGDFNVFVFGDMDHHFSDIEGPLAVGGNLTLSHYSIAKQLGDQANHKDTLIVGGDLQFSDGRIYHGNARSGGTVNMDSVGFYDDDPNHPNGRYIPGNPLDFNQIEADLKQDALGWSGLTPTGQVRQECFGTGCRLFLEGNSPDLNVFSLESSFFDTLHGFYLDAPLESAILINVSGMVADLSDFAFFRKVGSDFQQVPDNSPESSTRHDGNLTQGVLFNFFQSTSLSIHEIGVKGSIIAPWADITFFNGHIDGNLIANNLSGHPESDKCGDATLADQSRFCAGQSNWYPFRPFEPSTPLTPLPEPPLIGWIVVLIAGLLRRYSKAPNK